MIDLDNGRTLGFSVEEEVKYADAVTGGANTTIVVRLSGGRDARIEPPFMIFRNKDRSYRKRGTPDNIRGVLYRTGPKGWIDSKVAPEWLRERRVIRFLLGDRAFVLYLGNCSGRKFTSELEQAAARIRTEIRYFHPNLTNCIQPCDCFAVQKIRTEWSRR